MPNEEKLLIIKSPEVAKEWHPSRNGDLTPWDVTNSCDKKVWWQCLKFEHHIYERRIADKTRYKKGCTYCSGLKVSLENSLETLNPDLTEEWHPTKNKNLKPSDFTNKRSKKIWWQCTRNPTHK